MSSAGVPVAAGVPAPKICFNALCKEPRAEGTRRRGWRLRSGDFAELCERCYGAYEQGSFCDTFHSDIAGWRNCDACGKRVHCGCIVSIHSYVLLDAGGVGCIVCARKSFLIAPNQMWPPSLHLSQPTSERKDLHLKSWKPSTGAFPGHWRQAANLWSVSRVQSDLQQRLAYEFDRPSSNEKYIHGHSSMSSQEKKFEDMHERMPSSSTNQFMRDRYANGNTSLETSYSYSIYHREEGNLNGLQDPGHIARNDPMSSRKGVILDPSLIPPSRFNLDSHPSSCANSIPPSISKEETSSLPSDLAASFPPSNAVKDSVSVSSINHSQGQIPPPSLSKQFYTQNTVDGELQTQMRNGRPRVDARARSQLLPRYWPRITDRELQKITGENSNSVITPLFEKMLSASDAGRIGRLVLPKKCAEAYFPTISQPEGLPLKVQDGSGKEWVFQFRFWPNNNSRMYVLEGVTPCIQAMQLQAGDTVTFSRIDPEGKLVMGFRKASTTMSSAEQDTQTPKSSNGFSSPPEGNTMNIAIDSSPNAPLRPVKGGTESKISANPLEQATRIKSDGGFIQKDGSASRPSQGPSKRKASSLGSKVKRLRMDSEDSMELKVTWEEAQELLRPPLNHAPTIVVVEGHEFEEYEEAPVLGKKTYFVTNQAGDTHQWAQCEDCSKWRKLPVDALLPYRWTCSANKWDPERTSCSVAQELSMEQLAELMPAKSVFGSTEVAGASKRSKVKVEADIIEGSDGLDTLANLAILDEGEGLPKSSQPTTKHPRHRPGCSCIVCIQPPSGKGPKHKQTCTCNVCLTVRRRFRTLMMRREKRQSEKEAETAARKQHQPPVPLGGTIAPVVNGLPAATSVCSGSFPQNVTTDEGTVDELSEHRKTSSTLKAQIDLNIQPEREEEPSPKSDAVGIMRLDDPPTKDLG